MQEDIICPYPGLRPFNEDEAIFFKGRDEHIEQITRQLEAKKFLMLTGASGDGKSSLVYAGLIPNARAGFFKAKFNNWIVVDFRPERSPLSNLTTALSNSFGKEEKERFEKELKFGFSALVDIYTQSKYYVDKNSPEFLALEEAEKKKALRKGANLMILVDQFEEFFTNPENYSHGKTSVDSQLVVNLMLETSRIALENDIPIYVICTMRSDYIGQCASFRGLPEAIGFSQFFVPRLKRNEIYQVIEEPAVLNGNNISKRLIEVLINEMDDGIDQLPVLQHALNQIWQVANKGADEMDLIHFAKIGGIQSNYLPIDQKEFFLDWINKIPEHKKSFFENPSLDNVLDSHANELYFAAYSYFKEKNPNSTITIADAHLIIEATFKCLTKIDQSRGVRNRMTLGEVVNIIDQPHIKLKEVSGVIEIFRQQGNTFLKPFIDEVSGELTDGTVLDITHESLIRNWSNLIDWANEENEDYLIWLDFEKQLDRWVNNEKVSGYLLPIGSLTFFETWINKKKPNKYWLLKYDESDSDISEKLYNAEQKLKNATQFIKKSARKLFVSRTILKYGAQRIAVIISSIIVVISCIYLYFDYVSKQNSTIVKTSENRGVELLSSSMIKTSTKSQFLLLYENIHHGSIVNNLSLCGDDSVQIRTSLEVFNKLNQSSSKLRSMDSTLSEIVTIKSNITDHLFNLVVPKFEKIHKDSTLSYGQASRLYWLSKTLEIAGNNSYDSSFINKINNYNKEIINLLYEKYITSILVTSDTIKNNELFNAVAFYLIAFQADHDKVNFIINKISPFENDESKKYFETSFPKNSNLTNGEFSLKYNGGYELLASLYAYVDNDEMSFRAIDSITSYDNNYLSRYNHGFNQVAFSHWLGSKDSSHFFIEKLATEQVKRGGGDINQRISALSFEDLQVNLWISSPYLFLAKSTLHYNRLSYYAFKNCQDKIFDWYQDRLWHLDLNTNEAHFQQANIFKFRAANYIYLSDTTTAFQYLDKFKRIIESIEPSFLADSIAFGSGTAMIKSTRKAILFHPTEVSLNYTWNFTSNWNQSLNFILEYYNKWDILNKYDFSDNELKSFLKILYNDYQYKMGANYYTRYNINQASSILTFSKNLSNKIKDKNTKEDFRMLVEMFETIDPNLLYEDKQDKFLDSISEKKYFNKEYYNCESKLLSAKLNVLRFYLFKLLRVGENERVMTFINSIENITEKNNIILDLSEQCINNNMNNESMFLLKNYIKGFSENKKPPLMFYLVISQIGGDELLNFAYKHMRNADEAIKPNILKYMIRGMAQKSEYYLALSLSPTTISSNSELEYINEILRADFINKSGLKTSIEKPWLTNLTSFSERLYETSNSNTCYCTSDE